MSSFEIWTYLRQAGPTTVTDLASTLGMSPAVARVTLHRMRAEGQAETTDDDPGLGRGHSRTWRAVGQQPERRVPRKKGPKPGQRPWRGECVYCGDPSMGFDHVVPKGRGDGPLVKACRSCNVDKSNRTPEEWLAVLDARYGADPMLADEGEAALQWLRKVAMDRIRAIRLRRMLESPVYSLPDAVPFR